MNNQEYYLIYSLEGCYFSEKAENFLKNYGMPHQLIKVKQSEKEEYKKMLQKQTFPQVYYHSKDNRYYEIGGFSDLEQFIIKNYVK